MEQSELLGGAIRIIIGAVIMICAFRFVVSRTLVDQFRGELFGLRRDLFLFMADGWVEAQEPAYVSLRRRINAMLRFAERVTFMRSVLSRFVSGDIADESGREFEKEIANVPNEQARASMRQFKRKLDIITTKHLVLSSPILFLLLLVVILKHTVKSFLDGRDPDAPDYAPVNEATQSISRHLRVDAIETEAGSIGQAA